MPGGEGVTYSFSSPDTSATTPAKDCEPGVRLSCTRLARQMLAHKDWLAGACVGFTTGLHRLAKLSEVSLGKWTGL